MRKAETELLRYLVDGADGALAEELASWFQTRPRFGAFVAANRDKVRKKLRAATDDDSLSSVRAELNMAYLLLADRRFELAPEAFGVGKSGPDLTITFRSNFRFNVEVTQIRQRPIEATDIASKLRYVLLGKLRQLPAAMANVLVIAGPSLFVSEDGVAGAVLLLKSRADRADDPFFAARGFTGARDFRARYLRLSAVCVVDAARGSAAYWANREARHALPPEPALALRRCLGGE